MMRSRFKWALGIIAPWCLAGGVVMSFTAEAGQDFIEGATRAPLAHSFGAPADIMPNSALLSGDLGGFGLSRSLLREARLSIGSPKDLLPPVPEMTPKLVLKPNAHKFPEVVRTHKSDPKVGLRPTFDSRLNQPGGLEDYLTENMIFRRDETDLASTFLPYDNDPVGPDSVAHFEPWPDGEAPTTTIEAHDAGASPGQGGSVETVRPAAVAQRLAEGATPAVPRAVALSSTTPAPADATPVEIIALPGVPRTNGNVAHSSIVVRQPSQPDYAAFISQKQLDHEKKCLAEAVYFEARSEPEEGQAAVAQVILNRVSSGLYPSSICGVVYQNRRHYKACQFSFACEGKSLRITEPDSWRIATRIADEVLDGKTWLADVGGATHYHANYVRPRWAKRLTKMDVIGKHVFYRLKPGQT